MQVISSRCYTIGTVFDRILYDQDFSMNVHVYETFKSFVNVYSVVSATQITLRRELLNLNHLPATARACTCRAAVTVLIEYDIPVG